MKAQCQKIVNLIYIYCDSGQVSQNSGQLSKNSCHLIVSYRLSKREFESESILSKVCSSPLPFSFPRRRVARHKSKIGILKNACYHCLKHRIYFPHWYNILYASGTYYSVTNREPNDLLFPWGNQSTI